MQKPQWAGAPLSHFSEDDREALREAADLLVRFGSELAEERLSYLAGRLEGLAGGRRLLRGLVSAWSAEPRSSTHRLHVIAVESKGRNE